MNCLTKVLASCWPRVPTGEILLWVQQRRVINLRCLLGMPWFVAIWCRKGTILDTDLGFLKEISSIVLTRLLRLY